MSPKSITLYKNFFGLFFEIKFYSKSLYRKNMNTLKKESSRKKTLKRTSLIKQAKLIREQQKILHKKVLNVIIFLE